MLYDPRRKFIFIHIWKTGGESVAAALRGFCPWYFSNRYLNKAIRLGPGPAEALLGWRARLVCGQHLTADQVRRTMPARAFEESFKFAFVRNPWDWQVSNYTYALANKAHGQHRIIQKLGSFENYIRYQHEQQAPPQCSFIFGSDGRRLIDFVGRTENLDADFRKVCRTIGVTAELPLLNVSNRSRDWRSYYTPTTRAMIEQMFRRDLEEFGYSWGD